MKRKIVKIDESLCTGCGLCIPNCQEGALQIIDGKARLISDLFCDGLGACLGHCPENAITIEEREAEPYDESKVMEIISKQGENTIIAHLNHLKDHGEMVYYKQALAYLESKNIKVNIMNEQHTHESHGNCGCPGSKSIDFTDKIKAPTSVSNNFVQPSELQQWPIQLHLINPAASYFKKSDLLIAADCVAFAMGNFHSDYLKNKKLVIACPKLDSGKEIYVEKITALIEQSEVNTITIMMMEVPCCSGLQQIVQMAAKSSSRKVPVKAIIVGLQGDIIQETWI